MINAAPAILVAAALAIAPILAIAAALPGRALADGDPASDVLLGQDVFLPYSPISQAIERRVYSITAAARRAGYPLKIALIGAKSDLGVVPVLFGKPESYARFLSAELGGTAGGPVLVVMPGGFGLALQGHAETTSGLRGVAIGTGADGLGAAAVTATKRLATAAGHPLAASAASVGFAAGASPGTVRHALIAIFALTTLAAAALVVAALARRRANAGVGSPGPSAR